MRAETATSESLLKHVNWLKALALRLVRDASEADDVVQQTLLQALRRPPRDPQAMGAWLARVAQNEARQMVRGDQARQRREQRVGRHQDPRGGRRRDGQKAALPTIDIVERAELHRRLVDALLAVEEPFRTVVLLRYFDGLETKDIAESLGCSPVTVRTRLKRGLDRLRSAMDARSDGERRGWTLSLLVCVDPEDLNAARPTLTSGAVGGAGAVSHLSLPLVLAAVLALSFVVVVILWLVPWEAREGRGGQDVATPGAALEEGRVPRLEGRPRQPERALPRTAASASGAKSAEDEFLASWDLKRGLPMGETLLRGMVVDKNGEPIPGSLVFLRAKSGQPPAVDDPLTWSVRAAADGHFELADTWAARSFACAWAPGYERAYIEHLEAAEDLVFVLPEAPVVLVRVLPPVVSRRFQQDVQKACVRVRLTDPGGREFPRPDEPLRAEWSQPAVPGTATAVRIPQGARAHLTAAGPRLASEPAFARVPHAAKMIRFQLVQAGEIGVRIVDAASGQPIPWNSDGGSYLDLSHVQSGFSPEGWGGWERGASDGYRWRGGVPVGEFEVQIRQRGYLPAAKRIRLSVRAPGQSVKVEIPLVRNMGVVTLTLHVSHAEDSQRAGSRVEGGLRVFLRRTEDHRALWKHGSGMQSPRESHSLAFVLPELSPGLYDVLIWGGSIAPGVAYLRAVRLEGGADVSVDMALRDGYGFRPSDVLGEAPGSPLELRAEGETLGVLPWIWRGVPHETDENGFASVGPGGYIGPYPKATLTIVERLPSGQVRRQPIKPSIRPPLR